MIDQINSSNVLMDRVLNKPIKWSKQWANIPMTGNW
jgi:hypothetical protein